MTRSVALAEEQTPPGRCAQVPDELRKLSYSAQALIWEMTSRGFSVSGGIEMSR